METDAQNQIPDIYGPIIARPLRVCKGRFVQNQPPAEGRTDTGSLMLDTDTQNLVSSIYQPRIASRRE